MNDDLGGCNDQASLLCSTGASGPLCGTCNYGFIYKAASRRCQPCEGAQVQSFIIMGIMGAAAALAALVFLFGVDLPCFRGNRVVHFFRSIDSGSLKVAWVTYQIIASTSFNLNITFPSPFSDMLGLLNFFSLDFLSTECFVKSADRYYATVYLYSIFPLVIAAGLLVVCILRLVLVALRGGGVGEANHIKSQHLWFFLLETYVVLPPVAMKQLQSLDCITLPHDGSAYLRVDTAIDCRSDGYLAFRDVNLCFIFVYQMIPMLWYFLLWGRRDALNPPVSQTDPLLALFVRDRDVSLKSLRFLFDCYRSDRWWFEVAEMYRRMVFVSVIPLVSSESATRASFGAILAIASMMYYREEQPFKTGFTNFIAYVAQACILLTFYAALAIETGVMVDFGLKDAGMGIFLALCTSSIFFLAAWFGYKKMTQDRHEIIARLAKSVALEKAVEYTDTKFKTTVDAIQNSMVVRNDGGW